MSLAKRWIIYGDSIDAGVYDDNGVANPCELLASALPHKVGISVNNLSSPGQRITEGGTPGFGATVNKNAVGTVVGYSGASGIVITLGTNDYSNPSTGMVDFIDRYRDLISYCRTTLWLPVVIISPINRADGDTPILHTDGTAWKLWHFRYFVEMLAYEEMQKPGPFLTLIKGTDIPLLPEHYVADGVHLNADGHKVRTDYLIQRFKDVGYWT